MEGTDKGLTAVNVEVLSVEDLDGLHVIAKVESKPNGSNMLARADGALQLASDVLEAIPEKGLFKVEVPDGFTLQDLVPAKGDDGAFRAIVKDSKGKMAGQAKLREAAKINPTQIAGAGLAAAAMVVGQAYMTEISDSLHSIDEKLDKVAAMIADEQRAKLMNALDIAKDYSRLYEDYRQKPDALSAARNEIERCYNDVGAVLDWTTLQLGGLEKKARDAKASEKELRPILEELHSLEDQFGMSLKALSALGMTRMYYDGAADERSSLIERDRILEKSSGFLKKRASVAGTLEVKIGAMKGTPVALPKGNDRNPLRNLTSMTPRAAARRNLLETKVRMQSDLRTAQASAKEDARACTEGIRKIAAASRDSKTILTDGENCWLVEGIDEGQGQAAS